MSPLMLRRSCLAVNQQLKIITTTRSGPLRVKQFSPFQKNTSISFRVNNNSTRNFFKVKNKPTFPISSSTNYYALTTKTSNFRHLLSPYYDKVYTRTFTQANKSPLATASRKTGRKKYIWYIANVVKYIRIPFLIFSIYHIGHTQGIIDYARDPQNYKASLRTQLFLGIGGDEKTKIGSIREGEQIGKIVKFMRGNQGYGEGSHMQTQMANVVYVSEKILQSARILVQENIRRLEELRDKNNDNFNEIEYTKWQTAEDSLDPNGDKWTFFLIDVRTPNAFVSEVSPYTIFVTTALLEKYTSNHDELALILGHELSHLMLAHNSKTFEIEKNLKTLEVFLLTLDPTQGVLSFFVVAALDYARNIFQASHSRKHETEADELGIKLAAMSCFDTRNAPEVFRKMHDHHLELDATNRSTLTSGDAVQSKNNVSTGNTDDDESKHRLSSFLDTHPPSLMRYEYLMRLGMDENPSKYEKCRVVRSRFWEALTMSSKK